MPFRSPVFKPRHACIPQARSTAQKLYGTRWTKLSVHFKQNNPLCLGCQAVGRISQTSVTDHVIPHEGNEQLFWDEANWQPACTSHHNVVKQKLELMRAAGQACDADMRLDSPLAQRLTVELLG